MKDENESSTWSAPKACDRCTQTNSTYRLVDQLEYRYHSQALEQANVLFWFSLAATVVGLILIIYTVIRGSNGDHSQLLFKALPGAMIEVLAGLIFKQAAAARNRATSFFDRLRADKRYKDVADLVESVGDRNVQDSVRAWVVLHKISDHTRY